MAVRLTAHGNTGKKRGAGDNLTPRERDVLHAASLDDSIEDTAKRLVLTAQTVKFHRANILRKLDVHSIAGAVAVGLRKGMISMGDDRWDVAQEYNVQRIEKLLAAGWEPFAVSVEKGWMYFKRLCHEDGSPRLIAPTLSDEAEWEKLIA